MLEVKSHCHIIAVKPGVIVTFTVHSISQHPEISVQVCLIREGLGIMVFTYNSLLPYVFGIAKPSCLSITGSYCVKMACDDKLFREVVALLF